MNSLLLAGGRSKRMGRDKSLIVRPDGLRQIDHIAALAAGVSDQVFLSLRDGENPPLDLTVIPDLRPGDGPLGALVSAAAEIGGPLLVIGCDLYLLDVETLICLLENRDTASAATCFRNRIDHRAEPLCAIYEAAGLASAANALAEGNYCARKFLESLNPHLIDLPNPAALDNANTPDDLDECFAKLRDGVVEKNVTIRYFAKLREERGTDMEIQSTLACTAAGLYAEISFRHRLSLDPAMLRVAVNGDFAAWNAPLHEGDEVVFIPPVAGG